MVQKHFVPFSDRPAGQHNECIMPCKEGHQKSLFNANSANGKKQKGRSERSGLLPPSVSLFGSGGGRRNGHQSISPKAFGQDSCLNASAKSCMSSILPMLTRHHCLSENSQLRNPTPRFSISSVNFFPFILSGNKTKLVFEGRKS